MARATLTIFLLALICNFCQAATSCGRDISEEMFKAELVVLARIKKVSSEGEMIVRVSKVIKAGYEGGIIKPKKKLIVRQPRGLCKRSQVKPKRKYIFVLSAGNSGWELVLRPLRPSKRIKKMTQNMFCAGCGAAPLIKSVSESRGVKIYRYLQSSQVKQCYNNVCLAWLGGEVSRVVSQPGRSRQSVSAGSSTGSD